MWDAFNDTSEVDSAITIGGGMFAFWRIMGHNDAQRRSNTLKDKPMNQDKIFQLIAGIVGIAALVFLVYIGEFSGQAVVPIIIAVLAGLGAYESGRRGGRQGGRRR